MKTWLEVFESADCKFLFQPASAIHGHDHSQDYWFLIWLYITMNCSCVPPSEIILLVWYIFKVFQLALMYSQSGEPLP